MASLFVRMVSCPVLASAIAAAAPVQGERPNIVILYADDMGYGDLAAQNPDARIPTPHLDRLAAEGLRFTDAHSSSGICSPSRYALLTGRYHWRKFHNIVDSWEPSVFSPGEFTLPRLLKRHGYATACIGKWHLGWDWSAIRKPGAKPLTEGRGRTWPADAFDWSKAIPGGPTAQGFDYYFGDDVPNFPPYAWIENDRVLQPPTIPMKPEPPPTEGNPECRPGPMVPGWRLDRVMPTLTERAVRWIAGRKGKPEPFFLFFPWTSPHAPIVPAPQWQGRTRAGGYGDYLAQSDDSAGQVLRALDENGFRTNTLVIFSSDNGPESYAYPRIRNSQHRSMGPLRGLKRDLWDGGHRVPLLIRWPGKVKPGTVTDELMSQIDLVATLAAILGADLPKDAAQDSFNQLPLLLGAAGSARTSLVHNTHADYAIRSGRWTLIAAKTGAVTRVPAWFDEANGYSKDAESSALYDMRQDIAQRRNLIREHPAKAAELLTELNRIRQQAPRAPPQ